MTSSLVQGFLIAVIALGISWQAQASRLGKVDAETVDVYETPQPTSRVIATLKKGTSVLGSNFATEGFFKIKTKDGTVGWVLADTLILGETPGGTKPERDPSMEKAASEQKKEKKKENSGPSVRISGFGGFHFFNAGGIVVNFDDLSLGVAIGGELGWMMSERFALAIRGAKISKSTVLTDFSTTKNYSVEAGSLPIMLGLEAALIDEASFLMHFGAYAGLGLQTHVISTSLSDTSNNVATVSTSVFTWAGKLDLHFKLSKVFSLFLEGGYQYLKTSTLPAPNPAGNGGAILKSTFSIDLSGPFAGGGISFAI